VFGILQYHDSALTLFCLSSFRWIIKQSLSQWHAGIIQLTTVRNDNGTQRPVLAVGPRTLDFPYHAHAVDDLAKDDMFTVQVRGGNGGEEELAAIGVGAGIRHAKNTGLGMFQLEILVVESTRSIDGHFPCSVPIYEISSLTHEVGDYSMERATSVTLHPPTGVFELARAEAAEVFRGGRNDILEEFHCDAAERLSSLCHVEEDDRVGRRVFCPFARHGVATTSRRCS